MTENERKHFNAKGIFTVTQLSYIFRPRRRPKRLAGKREPYHHSLKALAIREKKIHIIGTPELKIGGTRVYLDIEGLPDSEFYYLIGLLIETTLGSPIHHSLWADTIEDEKRIWAEFLEVLSATDRPSIIHYGSFETTFLKRMCKRYGAPPEGSVAYEAIQSAVNLVSVIFARVYFPTYSNSLKDIAKFLGFEWSARGASGLQSIMWRHEWVESRDPKIKERLITYNSEDCEALEVVVRNIKQLGMKPGETDAKQDDSDIVDVESLQVKKGKWGKFTSKIDGFQEISRAAHWDYQRERVYIRSIRKSRTLSGRRHDRVTMISSEVIIVDIAPERACPNCHETTIEKIRHSNNLIMDISISKFGIQRNISLYRYNVFKCKECGNRFGVPRALFWPRSKYGRSLVAYILYQLVVLYIPQHIIVKALNRLLGFALTEPIVHNIKILASRVYSDTVKTIQDNILNSNLVHVDETRVSVKGRAAYVWVFANHFNVVYLYSDTREGQMMHTLLKDFRGVVVSDFFGAYDSLDCPQQKCLIHLMRDLNDDVLDHPFEEELKRIVVDFAELLRPVIATVDRFGLKKRFLSKHIASVNFFYDRLIKRELQSEAAEKCRQRFVKNKNKLFTFLHYDGVPWNNTNAEHAIKAFASLRDVIEGPCTVKGIEEYLVLLSVSQTCAYQSVDFIDFICSGEKDIATFARFLRPTIFDLNSSK